jgi:hypothetical protein
MRRTLVLQSVTFAMLVLALALTAWQVTETRHLARQGQQAHAGLCALKADLRERIKSAGDFLESHPTGVFGVTAVTIREAITNQEATLAALHPLMCDSDPEGT